MFKAFLNSTRRVIGKSSRSVPTGVRIYAIGDIHGCADRLDQLHALIDEDLESAPPAAVHVIYLGDYINRGPDSKGVLDRLTQPAPEGIVRIFLRGNHEEMLLAFLDDPSRGETWCTCGGYETLMSYRIDPRAVLARGGFAALAEELVARLAPAHKGFLTGLQSSYSTGDYFFCHAGVRPGVPLDQQDPRDLLRIRHEFLESDVEHGKLIVHGHTPVDAAEIRDNRICIDTGAYATGRLTTLVLEGEDRRFLHT